MDIIIKDIDVVEIGFLRKKMEEGCEYQIHYADYKSGEWTAPCKLTEERLVELICDYSINKIKLISGK